MEDQSVTSGSLQGKLTRWIVATTVIICAIAGLIAGSIAFLEAKEVQDEVLVQIAQHVTVVEVNTSGSSQTYQEDSTIKVESLTAQNSFSIPTNQPDGLATFRSDDDSWRVYITTKANQQRIVVAQQTELRNEIALANMTSATLPIAMMAIILISLIHWIIAKRLQPIKQLAQKADQQTANNLNSLSSESVPLEISPFIDSINRLLQRTKQTIERQKRFIADASHELRTPLAALSLLAENAEQAQSDTDRKNRQQLLRKGLDRLNELVNRLLDLARLQNQDLKNSSVERLDELVREVVLSQLPLAEQKQIDLGIVNTTAISVRDINGGLKQLVENAIGNAIRYTPEQGTIDISINQIDGLAELEIKDSGPGIHPGELQKVLTPFYRGKDQSVVGSGLGLSICKEVARQHQGELSLRNSEQGGLIFVYRQPLSSG